MWSLGAGAIALAACEPARELSTWPIALRQVASCEVGAPSQIELLALGDFPSRSYNLSGDAIEDVPVDLREILVRVTTSFGTAEGRRVRDPLAGDAAVWLLRPERSCPLADTGLRLKDGAVVAALPNGGALLAGGPDPQIAFAASSQAVLLVEGVEFNVPIEDGMLLRRAAASATTLRDVVLIAGGAPDRRAGAHDTYELFELRSARFVAARSGKLRAARMQHAAVPLADGRVLLVGGRADPEGAPLASIELLDPLAADSELVADVLQEPRVQPYALTLDSGRVLVLGGTDAANRTLGSVELFDPEGPSFELALTELPVYAQVSVAALPGARVAWLSCDHVLRGGAPCELALITEIDAALQVERVPLPFESFTPNGLTDLQLIYAGDGQLLWTGADDSDPNARRRAFVIDVAEPSLLQVDASRVPSRLVRLQNDLIAEFDDEGVSLRAAFTRGRYASPDGDMLAHARENLVLDAPGHWLWQEDGSVQALAAGARIDVAELRFAAFGGSAKVVGDFALLVYDGLGHNARVPVQDGELVLPGCRSQLRDQGSLQFSRAGSRLALSGTPCSIEAPTAALGVALVLEENAILRGLQIERQ